MGLPLHRHVPKQPWRGSIVDSMVLTLVMAIVVLFYIGPDGPANNLPAYLLSVLVLWRLAVFRSIKLLVESRLLQAVTVTVVYFAVSAHWSDDWRPRASVTHLGNAALVLVFVFSVVMLVRDERRVAGWLMLSVIVAGTVAAVLAIYQNYAQDIPYYRRLEAYGRLHNPVEAGMAFGSALVAAAVFALTCPRWRLPLLGCAVAIGIGLAMTSSRGPMMAVVAAAGAVAVLHLRDSGRRRSAWLLAGTIAIVVMAVSVALFAPYRIAQAIVYTKPLDAQERYWLRRYTIMDEDIIPGPASRLEPRVDFPMNDRGVVNQADWSREVPRLSGGPSGLTGRLAHAANVPAGSYLVFLRLYGMPKAARFKVALASTADLMGIHFDGGTWFSHAYLIEVEKPGELSIEVTSSAPLASVLVDSRVALRLVDLQKSFLTTSTPIASLFMRGFSDREAIWRAVFQQIQSGSLVLGKGIEDPAEFEFGYPHPAKHAHSIYLSALYYGGAVGLLLLLWMMLLTGRQALSIEKSHDFLIIVALGVYAVVMFAFDGDRLVTKPGLVWILFWLPVALVAGLGLRAGLAPKVVQNR